MESIQTITVIIFVVTIGLVIVRWIDSVVAAMLGVVAMIIAGSMTEVQAFEFVDWNVITILVSIWLIAGYFGKTGIPEYLGEFTLRLSRGNVPMFVTLIGALAGFISMFIDNVVVVLMLAPVVFHIRKLHNFEATGAILFIGLCSNFMGTALLLGDLPPQMLHSVTGIEFFGFIWHSGRPSSFIILTVTYLVVVTCFYFKFRRSSLGAARPDPALQMAAGAAEPHIKNRRFALVVCSVFILTIVGMSLRQYLGVKLGFIALSGAILLVFVFEIFGRAWKLDPPDLEEMLAELDWKAIGFYIALFALVGGLEHTRILEIVAAWFVPYLETSLLTGVSLLYWVSSSIVGLVEHDAYILTLLYVIRDLGGSNGINPWPLYWALVWAGTLGSNLTIAGAPALYVALTMGEKEDARKWSLREFLGYSVPYVLISLIVCYILLVVVWILPFMQP
jgi:Na+/H+ antiporter NhaD/arsenite permease-like protein